MTSRRSRPLALAALCLALAACDFPRLPGTAIGKPPRSATIDLDAVAKALGRDKALREQLESANEQLTGQISELATGLRNRVEAERAKLGAEPSGEQQVELRNLLAQAQLQLRRGQDEARRRAQQVQAQLVAQFRAEVTPFAERIARERGINVVLIKTTVLWSAPESDLTQAVIDAMRAASPPPDLPASGG